jgi:hypothetical protein
MRSEREQLARDEGIANESRYIRWAAVYGVETDPEEFLLNANLFLASDMDRVRVAYLELTQSQINNADDEEIKEACETGNRLFADPRGVPASLYGTRRFNGSKPGGPSWGSKTAPVNNPEELLGKLASSAMGCYFILNVLEELLERARKRFWGAGDRLRLIRLLGRNPADGIADRRVAEIFAASHALRPVGKPFDDLLSDMTETALEAHVKDVVASWPDLSQRGEKEKARQSLIDLVEGEIERVTLIAAEHEENAGDDAARTRALNGFVFSPKAEAMRRWFARAKGSVERGVKALRQETRARKADSDAQSVAPVPGKDISPYDGRPASWWAEKVGGGKRGDLRSGRGRGLETGAQQDCGNGGAVAAGGSGAEVDIGRETQADVTPFDGAHDEPFDGAHDGRSVPATANATGRGWDSVVVEESDIVACGGYLPEMYLGGAGENDNDSEAASADALPDVVPNPGTASSDSEEGGTCDTDLSATGAGEVTREGLTQDAERACDDGAGDGAEVVLTLDVRECPPSADGGGDCVNAPNEANLCDDMCIAQHRDLIEVPTNSSGVSALDGCQTNPIFLGTKPMPAGGAETGPSTGLTAGGSGGDRMDWTGQPDRTDSVADARREREALKARMCQQFVRMQAARWAGARVQPVTFDSGVANGGEASAAAGEPMVSQEARGP